MSDAQDKDSRTEAPTGRRLAQAREQGDVPKSPEVASTFALAAAAAVVLFNGGAMARGVTAGLLPFIAHPDAMDLSSRGGLTVLHAAVGAAAPGLLVLGAAAAAGVAGNLIQTGVIFAPAKLQPNFGKLNPMSGFAALFGVDNLISFGKSLFKLAVMAAVVASLLKDRLASLAGLPWLDPVAILPVTLDVVRRLMLAGVLVFGVCAGADVFIQRYRFTERMKMSREDIKQENKDSDGDPQIKARLKQQRMIRAKKRMIANVPKATVVIMNPTHYAVALRYVQGETAAPVCVAKGLDAVALKIREIAEENRIPVVEEPPLARALYAVVDVDETIPREHYQAVARIVGFVLNTGRRRARPLRAALAQAGMR
jgi:flagellar biosynthesis protein FlhB